MNFGIERIYEAHPWKVIESNFIPEKNVISESVFSLANEYMGVRGMLEEGFSGRKMEGSYIGGIYLKEKYTYVWQRKGFPSYGNSMANTTNWVKIKVEVDGETFDMGLSCFYDYCRELDLKEGILTRKLVFKTVSGCETLLKWERFISYADRHMGTVRFYVKAMNHTKKITVQLMLDDTVGNLITDSEPKVCISRKSDEDEKYLLMKIASTGQYYIHRMYIDTNLDGDVQSEAINGDRTVGHQYSFLPQQGKEYIFDKIVSVWTSRDAGYPYGLIQKDCSSSEVDVVKQKRIVESILNYSKENIEQYIQNGYEILKKNHILKLGEMWERLDIEISGDILAQQGIRYCLFQMTNTYQGHDSDLNVGAKGLTGEFYWGRYFWDSEGYCLPFYLFTNPDAAKNLVEYRYNTLGAARENANNFGYKGAMYPWQTIDGSEDCLYWEYAYFEIHINAIIPYAIYLYTHITGDNEYLITKGIEVLLETSRFWESRISWDPQRNAYGIFRITNVDEYQQLVNNGFYTNYMAKRALEFTIQVIEMMEQKYPDRLQKVGKKIGFDMYEKEKWAEIAEKMILNTSEEYKIFVEDDMFLSLVPLSREEISRDDIPVEKRWSIDRFLRHDIVKQPDVLLAMFLFRNSFTFDEKLNNYRFYEQRTIHGSSLSPSIHSILAAELGRLNQAYEYYLWASRLDLDDYNNNTYEGLHVSAMSGTWLNIVYGFGGMVTNGEILEFKPIIPDAWDKYSFKIVYRGRVLKISVDKKKVTYQVVSGLELKIKVYGQEFTATVEPQSVDLPASVTQRSKFEAVIFDLDGVIIDTARYHYMAWKKVADQEGIYFDERINERLKGVSRMESLRIILERRIREYSSQEQEAIAAAKNDIYVEMLEEITPGDILPGILLFLDELKEKGIKTSIFSASRNTQKILEKLGIGNRFDVIVSGNDVVNTKPDPEGFVLAAKKLGVKPESCVVIEDAYAGIEGAKAAKMKSLGIGQKLRLHNADYVLTSTKYLSFEKVNFLF